MLSTFLGGLARFSSEFAGTQDVGKICVWLSLQAGVHSVVQSVFFFWIMSDSTMNLVKTYQAYSRSLEVD